MAERTAPLRDVSAEILALAPGLEIVIVRALGGGEDARDALQDVLTRGLAAAERGDLPDDPAQLAPYVYGIARHVIADAVRARVRAARHHALPESIAAPQTHPLDALVHEEELSALTNALRRLDATDQELLRRCYVDGESIADVARTLGEPPARLRKRKSRALQRLRVIVHELGAQRATRNSAMPPDSGHTMPRPSIL